ncbi:MAG: fumarate hydratase [Eubacteriales bacterium]|jgi:fumarate hydratase subunit alpha
MRKLDTKEITRAVKELCIQANYHLGQDVVCAIGNCKARERNPLAREILGKMEENLQASAQMNIPICQDTGMAIVFVELGQQVCLEGALLEDAVNEGVRQGYQEGYMRCSVVADPIRRGNTNDNTPAVLHLSMVEGQQVRITVAPKGFGSENMSQMKMMTPAASQQDIVDYVVDCVRQAGSNPCPPVIVGVGIGGSFEKCAMQAKKALLRPIDQRNPDPFYARLEEQMLEEINRLDVGPQGFGGDTTALGVNIETYPTHIAGLPVAVNMSCHVTRHASCVL